MATRTTVVKRTRGAVELLRERFADHELLTYQAQGATKIVPVFMLRIPTIFMNRCETSFGQAESSKFNSPLGCTLSIKHFP